MNFFYFSFNSIVILRVKLFRGDTCSVLSTDIGGFGGLEPLIPARLDPCSQGIVDGTLGSPRPTELPENWNWMVNVVGTVTPR